MRHIRVAEQKKKTLNAKEGKHVTTRGCLHEATTDKRDFRQNYESKISLVHKTENFYFF